MNAYILALNTAIMLQDQVLIQMLNEGAYDETHSACKMQMAVSDAVAEVSKLYPVYFKKTLTTENGLIKRSLISGDGALVVASVTSGGKAVPYTVDYAGVHTDGPGTYEVTYSPDTFDVPLDDVFDVAPEVGLGMMMHLVARNYCMMSGRMEEAAMYDSRYNDFVEKDRLKRRARIPARKFV